MFLGDGRIDVKGILACLPPDIVYALEIPGERLAYRLSSRCSRTCRDLLTERGVQAVSFGDRLRIDALEVARGRRKGKPR
jgi:hypothetical protein